jgi:hypothetical protein
MRHVSETVSSTLALIIGKELASKGMVAGRRRVPSCPRALLCITLSDGASRAGGAGREQTNELAILHTIVRSKGFVWIANHPNSAFHWSQAGPSSCVPARVSVLPGRGR